MPELYYKAITPYRIKVFYKGFIVAELAKLYGSYHIHMNLTEEKFEAGDIQEVEKIIEKNLKFPSDYIRVKFIDSPSLNMDVIVTDCSSRSYIGDIISIGVLEEKFKGFLLWFDEK